MPDLGTIPEDDTVSCIFEWPDRPNRPFGLVPIAWWPLEESAGDRIDVVNGYHEKLSGSGISRIAGKVGFATQENFSCLLYNTTPQIIFPDPLNWTVLGWLNPVSAVGTLTGLVDLFHNSSNSAALQFQFGGTPNLFAFMQSNTAYASVSLVGTPGIGSGWFFFLMECRNGVFGVQLNNGTLNQDTVNPVTWTPGFTFTLEFDNLSGSSPKFIAWDELAVFGDVLTDQEKTTIYNSGNGVTWPI